MLVLVVTSVILGGRPGRSLAEGKKDPTESKRAASEIVVASGDIVEVVEARAVTRVAFSDVKAIHWKLGVAAERPIAVT